MTTTTVQQDKGISPTAAMSQGLRNAGVTAQENIEKAGATISSQVDKMKAGFNEEERMQADMTKDKRQADAEDRAEAKKAEIQGNHPDQQQQQHRHEEHHPPPFTKTPFV